MSDIPTREPDASDAQSESENNQNTAQKEMRVSPRKSRESLFGTLLFASMILSVVASIGGIGWVMYARWKMERAADSRASITELIKKADQETGDVASPATATPQKNETDQGINPSTNEEIISVAKKLEISVLNGGAAKGSAGILADFLKKEGYLKTDMGNTLKDYAGVIIYYTASLEKEAEMIQASVIKKYPQAKILPADSKNKETLVSQVTIILGK